MEANQATRYDLAKLFERPAKRMKVEYRNAGFGLNEVKRYFIALLGKNQAVAFRRDGKALAVLGWDTVDGSVQTSFVAFEEYFEAQYVRFLRRYMKQFQSDLGGVEITSHSFSEHPRTAKWFMAIGFRPFSVDGVHVTYVLPPTV